MKLELLVPDISIPAVPRQHDDSGSLFSQAYTHAANLLDQAQEAEKQFAYGKGSLLEMSTSRACADIALSTAVAVASRIGQFASTLGNMSL